MKGAYKELINAALQRYHFELASRGITRDPVLLESLNLAISGLYTFAFGSDDGEALEELTDIRMKLSEGEIIKPFLIEGET